MSRPNRLGYLRPSGRGSDLVLQRHRESWVIRPRNSYDGTVRSYNGRDNNHNNNHNHHGRDNNQPARGGL
ncbi:MAG: hypothetical protein VX833_00495 [Actinomycetota bacterium]|nr:hypothetical protein [Actinomycetota bacterium]